MCVFAAFVGCRLGSNFYELQNLLDLLLPVCVGLYVIVKESAASEEMHDKST